MINLTKSPRVYYMTCVDENALPLLAVEKPAENALPLLAIQQKMLSHDWF